MLAERLECLAIELEDEPLSTSLLRACRLLRGHVSEEELTALNRELLGYLPEELRRFQQALDELSVERLQLADWTELPRHRLIPGTWLSPRKGTSRPGVLLCGDGIVSLEQKCSVGIVVVECDIDKGYLFLCDSSYLVELRRSVSMLLKSIILRVVVRLRARADQSVA